ncbi:Aldose sugar dehydrogenase YliI [bacterium HR40]|nr:Aldose sugar dehydrogenase YliI [bacterium HR40]
MRANWLAPIAGVVLLVANSCAHLRLGPAAQAAEQRAIRVSSEQATFVLRQLTPGLEHPWGLAFLPDGRMLVSERPGRLRLVAADGTLDPQPLAGVPEVWAQGQGGLLDVAIHPEFATNALVYLSYAAAGADGRAGTHVARAQLRDRALVRLEEIFASNARSTSGVHFGSRLVFADDGTLFVTLGERGERELAQRLDSHAGKIVRIREDGTIPADNPFVGRAGALAEIWSLGHRNVQGAALHPVTRELWIHEHGPQGGDEINIARAGRNYGWPVVTFGREYGTGAPIGEGTAKAGMKPPLWSWVPSIAPSGMTFYRGERFPAWQGDLFVGALRAQALVRLELEGERIVGEERLLAGVIGRIRDVREGPDGFLYLLTDAADGAIWRLEPADGS